MNYFCQSVTLPSIGLGTATQMNPFIRIPHPGTELTFGQLSLTFRVDEDMGNYRELMNWMVGMGFPDEFDQYKKLNAQPTGYGIKSDATLLIYTSAQNPNIAIKFADLFPTSLDGITFDTQDSTEEFLQASASFAFRRFYVDMM
jgi:hypothetical protein